MFALSIYNVLILGLWILLCCLLIARLFRPQGKYPKPPGPRGLPIIGNLYDIPTEHEPTIFGVWHNLYGDICSVTIFGRTTIILNSHKAATEMLSKKSLNYSDRPYYTMCGDLAGWKYAIVLLQYADRFKTYRRMMHQASLFFCLVIGSRSNVLQFKGLLESEAAKAVRRLLDEPDNYVGVLRKAVGCSVLQVTYGYQPRNEHDPLVKIADEATSQLGVLLAPGGFLVDVLPFLKHVPEWFPGARFQTFARECRQTVDSLADSAFSFVLGQMAAGKSSPNFVANLLNSGNTTAEDRHRIKWAAESLYSAGADSPVSALSVFILAMTLYPEARRKAQAEIDAVVGDSRLPTMNDRDSLPYCNALAKEVIRWGTTSPLGAPHCVREDDIHDGYLIPKGSVVLANIWHFLHDPEVYKNPWMFNPDRLIPSPGKPAEQDPYEMCFGYGRRSCPGTHLADAMMFLFSTSILSVFDIEKAIDANGMEITPEFAFTSGALTKPKDFPCVIRPRSHKAEALIRCIEI
ncbi:cytochrome P450 [Stereum hirsutum FP-91666 SS1]|uniref:cytochrome P450 n=1 Tax=Stereum hirsutum (strain FP-91666) TaxID=721885 RepID=UPI000440DB63|nr:cytochrome P450 [Stereum hirsutum FP-91666 SS1]EIM86814.1 cytochrome P450 [Stereum hirsutum FP-91666 SS1]